MENKLLQVGDVIYQKGNYGIISRSIIDRITNTQAISEQTRFKRNIISNGYVKLAVSRGIWSSSSYYISTPELDAEWEKMKLLDKVTGFNNRWKNLSTEQLQSVVDIIDITINENK